MKTNKTTQEYIGYLLSIANSVLWDNSSIAYPKDVKAFEKAEKIVSELFEREINKNQNRKNGHRSCFDDIGSEEE